MSFSIPLDDDDGFFDAESFFARSGDGSFAEEAWMEAVPLGNDKSLSFDPVVEARGPNGSLSRIPIAAYDGFHNSRQYFHDPYPSTSVASFSSDGTEAKERPLTGGGAVGAADNVMQGPVLMTGMAKAAHYVASWFEDDDSEEEEATSDEDETGDESEREASRKDESIRATRNGNRNKKGGCQAHQTPAEKAHAAK